MSSATTPRHATIQRRGVIHTSERDFMAQVIEAATLFGWTTYHPFLSKWSARGFPDLVLVRPPRLILAELKTDVGQPTPEQAMWLELLGQVPGIEVELWRPMDLDRILAVLRWPVRG
jgi:hypothetical protein